MPSSTSLPQAGDEMLQLVGPVALAGPGAVNGCNERLSQASGKRVSSGDFGSKFWREHMDVLASIKAPEPKHLFEFLVILSATLP